MTVDFPGGDVRRGGITLIERKLSVMKGDQKEANSQITKNRNK